MTAPQFTAPYINGQTIEVEEPTLTAVVNPANGQTVHNRINLSDNWADYYQDRFASPVRVSAQAEAARA